VCSSMWPMWMEPVTFGGGMAMEKVGAELFGPAT